MVGRARWSFALAGALLLMAVAIPAEVSQAEAFSLAFINNVATRVRFSDGDTFRVVEGPYQANCRLAGFNSLESYGPVHQWGDWHPFELWVIAKRATLNAKRGQWHCTTEGERDRYDRILMYCPDLAIDQIRHGFAHVMSIDDSPGRIEYIRAQHEAIRERRGMWRKGVPAFIMTSIHSAHEDLNREYHYNRRVSTWDGHTESYRHAEVYDECSWNCVPERSADMERVRAFATELRAHPGIGPRIAHLNDIYWIEIVARYARNGDFADWVSADFRGLIEPILAQARQAGTLGDVHENLRGGCLLYVEFGRWFGEDRAPCLRDHGTAP